MRNSFFANFQLWDPSSNSLSPHLHCVTVIPHGRRYSLNVEINGSALDFFLGNTGAVRSEPHIVIRGFFRQREPKWQIGPNSEVFYELVYAPPTHHLEPRIDGKLSPSSSLLAVRRTDSISVLTTREATEPIRFLAPSHTTMVYELSPNDRFLAAGGQDRIVSVWDIRRRELVGRLQGHTAEVTSLAFHPSSRVLASGSKDGTIRLWNVQDFQAATIKDRTDNAASAHPRIAGKSAHPNTSGYHRRIVIDGRQGRMISSALSSQVDVVAKGYTGFVQIQDLDNSRRIRTLKADRSEVRSITMSRDKQLIAITTASGQLTIFSNKASGEILRTWDGISGLTCVAFDPLSNLIAVCDSKNGMRLLNLENGQVQQQTHLSQPSQVKYSANGRRVGARGRKVPNAPMGVGVWESPTLNEVLFCIPTTTGALNSFAISIDGSLLSISTDEGIEVWDCNAGTNVLNIPTQGEKTTCVCFSPDAKRLVSGTADGYVRIWDARSGHNAITLQGHTMPVVETAFTPDGKTLASLSSDGTVILWPAGEAKTDALPATPELEFEKSN